MHWQCCGAQLVTHFFEIEARLHSITLVCRDDPFRERREALGAISSDLMRARVMDSLSLTLLLLLSVSVDETCLREHVASVVKVLNRNAK
jgi:hypothetical protein